MSHIHTLLSDTKKSAVEIARLTDTQRTKLVQQISAKILQQQNFIMTENQKDLVKMDDNNPKKDRLILNQERISWMVNDAENVAKLENPAGKVEISRELENGLKLTKISTPLGVVGIIYEARPNVTLDAICLALKSGNAVVLRGGTDAEFSNAAIVKVVHEVLDQFKISRNIIQLLPVDRKFVKDLLEAEQFVDIIIPRGSAGLIQFVRENSKIPTIETGAGVCHTFVEKTADLEMAANIVVNAKVQRPSVCNSLDTILVSQEIAADFLPKIILEFTKHKVDIFADETCHEILEQNNYSKLFKAQPDDFGREFLGFGCSVKIVNSPEEAFDHIAKFSSKHSEAIVTSDQKIAEKFLQEIDAASVYHNASTRFTDGSVFGLGAEIGISTQKLHARGPFALEKLVTEKWVLRGDGQIRE